MRCIKELKNGEGAVVKGYGKIRSLGHSKPKKVGLGWGGGGGGGVGGGEVGGGGGRAKKKKKKTTNLTTKGDSDSPPNK